MKYTNRGKAYPSNFDAASGGGGDSGGADAMIAYVGCCAGVMKYTWLSKKR